MRFVIKLTESNRVIESKIIHEARKVATPRLRKGYLIVKDLLPKLIKERITEDPVWQSLMSGRLRQELGLINPQRQLNDLLQEILSERSIPRPELLTLSNSKNVLGRMTFWAVPSDYQSLISSDAAYYYSVSRRGKTKIEWVRYLLTSGNRPIFFNTRIQYFKKQTPKSRAGFALMKRAKGQSYKLGEGTQNNNFLKKAMKDVEGQLHAIFILLLKRLF